MVTATHDDLRSSCVVTRCMMIKVSCVLNTLVITIALVASCPCSPGEGCYNTPSLRFCHRCPKGLFQDEVMSTNNCSRCRRHCGHMEEKVKDCTRKNDIICQCKAGYYRPPGKNTCLQHKPCKPGYGIIQQGTPWSDTICEPCEDGTYLPNESYTKTCIPCSSCPPGQEVEQTCSISMDTVCRQKHTDSHLMNDTSHDISSYSTTETITSSPSGSHPDDCQTKCVRLESSNNAVVIVGSILGAIFVILVLGALYRQRKIFRKLRFQREHLLQNTKVWYINADGQERPAILENVRSPNENGLKQIDFTKKATKEQFTLNESHHCGEMNRAYVADIDMDHSADFISPTQTFHRSKEQVDDNIAAPKPNNQTTNVKMDYSNGSVYTLHSAFTQLSRDLCAIQWEMLFRRLIGKGCDALLRRVKCNERDVCEQIYQMLLEWEKITKNNAKLDTIVNELEDLGENLVADEYRQKLSIIVY